MKKNLLIRALILNSIPVKKIWITLCFTFLVFNSYAQPPNWLWAASAGGTGDDGGNSIVVDGSGNSFVTGGFDSPSITFGTTTLTNAGGYDIFLVKYDAGGNVVWAKSIGGSNDEYGIRIAVDDSGSSFVTGYFYSSSITFGSTTLTNAGLRDIFIVKYDASGNAVWAKSAGGTSAEWASSIDVDGSGSSYVTGFFGSPSITFDTTTLTNAGSQAIFIVKYDAGGNVVWAKSEVGTGTGGDGSYSIAVDGSGSIYVSGYFWSSSITFGTTTLTNAGWGDIFIVKYDAGGNVVWAKSAGGSDDDYGYSIAVDSSGSSYVVGRFLSPTITFDTTTLTNAGGNTIFIVKYDASGNVLWAKSAGGSGDDYGYSIAVDDNGSSYVTGSFKSASITFGTNTLTNAGIGNIFIVKYDAGGNVVWAKSTGGTGTDEGWSIAVDGSGSSYVSGWFTSSSIIFGTTTLTNAGSGDMFVAKLASTVTSVEEAEEGVDVNVLPNPANNQLIIYSVDSGQFPILSIQIYDAFGQGIITQQPMTKSEKHVIDVSKYSAGIYFVKLNIGEKSYCKKIIIQRD